MIAFLMIVDDVLGHGLLEVPLAEGNDTFQTFALDYFRNWLISEAA
jgi:hypothetical protein